MNKSDKLRLYGAKDYTELIEFPVELVGKDGVVRRYTYEESLLVYAKRIESAHQRYRDRELASAEVDHCYKRIDQIKRSWKVVSSRRVESSADYAARYEESAAAECRAFIREFFGRALADRVATDEEPIPIYLSLVQHDGPLKVFHVSLANRKGGHLLYAFTFAWEPEKEGDPSARSQYTDWSRILAASPMAGDDVEKLLAAREGKEFGFLLTGPAGASVPQPIPDSEQALAEQGNAGKAGKKQGGARARVQSLIDEDPGNAEAHYALGVLLIGDADPVSALDEFKTCVELQPFYLDGYRMIASIADSLDLREETVPYLLQARHYFPDDVRIQYHLGLLLLRQMRFDEAKLSLDAALASEPGNARTRWLLEVLERCRKSGTDPASELAELQREQHGVTRSERIAVARPAIPAVFLVALLLAASLLLRTVEPMAATFAVALTLVVVVLANAQLRHRSEPPPRTLD